MPAHLSGWRSRSLICAALMSVALAAASKPHEHGVVRLDVSVDGPRLTIGMTAALDNWLGFERAPRTDAERQAAAAVLAGLRHPQQGTALWAMDAAAQCRLTRAEVLAPVLEPSSKPPTKATGGDHADLEATYEFECAQPTQVRTLDLGLFEAYKRIQRIEVQVAGPKGQLKVTLRRPARSVTLAR